MYENKAKNILRWENSTSLREHGAVEKFVSILGVAIKEGKLSMYFTVYGKIVLLHRATAL